jgi:hypothetical protein
VPEWVNDPAEQPAVLLAHRRCLAGTGVNGPPDHRLRFIDDQQHSPRGAPDRYRTEAMRSRVCRCHPEACTADRQLRDDVVPLAHAVNDHGAKSRLIELHGGRGTVDPQFRLDARHPRQYGAGADVGRGLSCRTTESP